MAYRAAFITGASSGIGEAFARALPPETALYLTARDGKRLAALADALRVDGRRVEIFPADLTGPAKRQAAIDWAAAAEPDLILLNAGFGRLGAAIEDPERQDRRMIAVNVLAPVEMAQALLPGMIARAERGGGRAGAIFVSSLTSFFAVPMFATYAASKNFLTAYGQALAIELAGRPVDLLTLCPGLTRTRFFERAQAPLAEDARAHSADRVAREALAQLGRRSLYIVGGRNRIAAVLSRFVPRALVARLAGRFARTLAAKADGAMPPSVPPSAK